MYKCYSVQQDIGITVSPVEIFAITIPSQAWTYKSHRVIMKRKCHVVSLQAKRALDSLEFWPNCAVIKKISPMCLLFD